MPGATLLAVALVVLVKQREGALCGRSRAGEGRRQSLIRPADFVIPLRGHRAALINRGCYQLEVVGHLPEHLTVGGLLHILVGETGNLFVAVDDDPQAVAPRSFLPERVNPASAPPR